MDVVIDTNIVLSGLKSRNGLSYRILDLLPSAKFRLCISVPLFLEYETILKLKIDYLTHDEIDGFLNYICSISRHVKIHYLWRPFLKDPHDDHLLELAVAANAEYIVTFNIKDLKAADRFGIRVMTPKEFLHIIGELQ